MLLLGARVGSGVARVADRLPCRLGSRFCLAQPLGVAAVGVLRVGRVLMFFGSWVVVLTVEKV